MLELFGDALLAILSGGATGLLGTGLSFITGYFQKRQAHRHEVELRRLDMEIVRIESAGFERVAEIEAEGARDQAAWKALEESYHEAARRWSSPGDGWLMLFVDFCRGMTRPGLTWTFVGLTGAIYFTVAADDANMRVQIVNTVLYLTTTTVLWWFGARQLAKAPGADR